MNNTYSLLVRSEEKGRALFETALYAIVMLSSIVSIGQFTVQPKIAFDQAARTVMVADANPQPLNARS
jgi:hypothetical protein